ncbi:hypothetical protein [Caulobacter sp. SSI4214]|uniref:hypothetical protein n=1 Tax=Caulobacter sp. SSI4214 TaxID=2575739 RepID=UPI00143C9795|nr:hypothetical protein [Caulobacter sp. SSI4214]
MKKQILGAACAFSLTVVGGYASAQTTTTDPNATTTSCRPTDPCYDVLPTKGISNAQTWNGANAVVSGALNLTVDHALSGVDAAATAVANNFQATGRAASGVTSNQTFEGEAYATLNAKLPDVTGDVSLKSTAMANNTSLTIDKMGAAVINQTVSNRDPSATLNAKLGNVDGAVDVAATAVNNNASINGDFTTAALSQVSHAAPVSAVANVNVNTVTGALTAAASAIGNTVSVKGF